MLTALIIIGCLVGMLLFSIGLTVLAEWWDG